MVGLSQKTISHYTVPLIGHKLELDNNDKSTTKNHSQTDSRSTAMSTDKFLVEFVE
jgi:hypothetical protein